MVAVMGIDLACDSSGICLPDGATLTVLAPKIKSGQKRTLDDNLERIDVVASRIEELLDAHRPDLVALEDYAPGIQSTSAHRLAEIGGCIRRACYRRGIPVVLVNNQHLKIYALGRANKVEKGDMRIAALKRVGVEPSNDDECDAWWLRAMVLDALGQPVVAMPQEHLRNQDKLAIPASLLVAA